MSMSDDECSVDYDLDDEQGYYNSEEYPDSPGSDDRDCSIDNNMEFRFFSSEEIRAHVHRDISEISSLLSVSNESAVVLLSKFGWDVGRIHEEWFSDEEKTRRACGLRVPADSSEGEKRDVKGKFFCGICLESHRHDSANNSAVKSTCGHVYCETCWRTYISTAINDGAGSLLLRCPEPSCKASVADMIGSLASDENRAKYENHLLRSYVEGKKNFRYCPGPGCEFAVECLDSEDISGCPWRNHDDYGCNRYEVAKKDGRFSEEENIREMVKRSLDRYTHHFERWIGNHISRKRALADIEELSAKHLEKLRDIHHLTMSQLQFIKDAWVQIVECRRVLKWSYAYGYYMPENEPEKKKFFEYLQGQAEFNLERLHSLVEKELSRHSNKEAPPIEFTSYSTKVVDLTKVTRGYFQNLGTALANGLSDVN
ncbi:OLC1v1028958C1 [Oldenlandia corymbosa var. corymbosa]|uniref:RBR-type E3 ubiquitin transferase n=1 Tax=Oldenlandia corymbosa var. corymbosa TaxID=529605 RepID=A0AAV1CDS3_OLDCO|nr:OLC1v1028958C1 [Oldenlandia corymbosa var. corymbosa]